MVFWLDPLCLVEWQNQWNCLAMTAELWSPSPYVGPAVVHAYDDTKSGTERGTPQGTREKRRTAVQNYTVPTSRKGRSMWEQVPS